MPKCARIIVKSTDADLPEFRQAVETLRGEGREVEVRVTWEEGDAERMAQEAAGEADHLHAVVAAGGDGLTNRVIRGLLAESGGRETALAVGIVPMGTANDFAAAAGIPLDNIEQSLRLAISEESRPVDAGYFGECPFLNMVTAGAGASATRDAPEPMKDLLGKASYFFMGLVNLASPREMQLRVESENLQWEGKAYGVIAANSRLAGGGLELCEDALIDDGLLDLCILDAAHVEELGGVLQSLLKGQREGFQHIMEYGRGERFRLIFEEPAVVNVDGEPLEVEREIDVSVRARVLRVNLPTSCNLFQPPHTS